MDFHFSRAASEQPGNAGTPPVNFLPVCFPIRRALAGANLWFGLVRFHFPMPRLFRSHPLAQLAASFFQSFTGWPR